MTTAWRGSANRVVAAAILLTGLVACASAEPGRLTSQTSDPKPVDAVTDNAPVLTQLAPGLVITLEISDNTPTLVDARVALLPLTAPRREEGELVHVMGLSNGKPVSSTAVPDQRVYVEEGVGLGVLTTRTLTLALPLPQRIDSLEVQLPGEAAPSRFDVSRTVDSFCKDYPKEALCREAVP